MVKQNSQTVKSIPPTSGEKGENEGKLFHKNSPQKNLCETGGGNEREMKGNFVFTNSFNCTVLYIYPFTDGLTKLQCNIRDQLT